MLTLQQVLCVSEFLICVFNFHGSVCTRRVLYDISKHLSRQLLCVFKAQLGP